VSLEDVVRGLVSASREVPEGDEVDIDDEGDVGGAVGRDLLNGEPVPAKGEGELERGDRLRIETPGGGGFGSEPNS
jgi:N-methylhydantoinase B/oxoprolinase/acetone carboxylase alpha subunit